MKHYICINDSGLATLGNRYRLLVAVTVQSAIVNTRLKICLLYDGPITDYVRKIEDLGCEVIRHELSFRKKLRDICKRKSANFNVASGVFMRLDIPETDKGNDCVICTDVDVRFRSDPVFPAAPRLIAAAPEMHINNYDHINSGVLLLDLATLRSQIPDFIRSILDGEFTTTSGAPYDQGHMNEFFRGKLDRLDPIFNWKPYWGYNKNASIVHWHGVKYPAAKALSSGLEQEIKNYHVHPEIYAMSPSGYERYMHEFEKRVETLPGSVRDGLTSSRQAASRPDFKPLPLQTTHILGPSHVTRWSGHVRNGVVPSQLDADRFSGIGGAPAWSDRLLQMAHKISGSGGRFALMVPDFRFGNGILVDTAANKEPLFQDGYLAIDHAALSPEQDQAMLERGIAALRQWHNQSGESARYIFWCLFGRQVHDRMAGRHIADGKYHHPVFNYAEITEALPGLDIVDLSPLLRRPMHDVRRLFLDSSSHPTQVAYLLLNGLIFEGLDALAAYDRAVATVESDLVTFARKIRGRAGRPILLTGRSVWLDTLMTTLGANGASKLTEAGLVVAPINRIPGQPALEEVIQDHSPSECRTVVISAGGVDLSELLGQRFGTPAEFWKGQPVIDWEGATVPTIHGRGETPRFAWVKPDVVRQHGALRPDLPAHTVELGPLGIPSWAGLALILDLLAELPDTRPD